MLRKTLYRLSSNRNNFTRPNEPNKESNVPYSVLALIGIYIIYKSKPPPHDLPIINRIMI